MYVNLTLPSRLICYQTSPLCIYCAIYYVIKIFLVFLPQSLPCLLSVIKLPTCIIWICNIWSHDNSSHDKWCHDTWSHDYWSHDTWSHDYWSLDYLVPRHLFPTLCMLKKIEQKNKYENDHQVTMYKAIGHLK